MKFYGSFHAIALCVVVLVHFAFPSHRLESMDGYDSGEDLFITQSTFRSVDTQDADEAVNFFDSSFVPESLIAKGDVVEYWDFSKSSNDVPSAPTVVSNEATTCAIPLANTAKESEPQSAVKNLVHSANEAAVSVNTTVNVNDNVIVGLEPFVPLVPDLLTDDDVDKVQDDVLQAAAKALTTEQQTDRFGKPVSDGEVQQHTGKGYVLFHAVKIMNC